MYRKLLVPTVTTIVMLVVLLGLGTWQVYRLQWKQQIMARIAQAELAPPVPLTSGQQLRYTKVIVSGVFRFDQVARFGADVRDTNTGPTFGFQQIVPLERDGQPPLMVDRGWIPEKSATPFDDPAGPVTVTGYIRPPDTAGWFSAADDPASRVFYTLNPATIGLALGIPNPAPFTLIALGPQKQGAYPIPEQNLPRPPNNHLAYIITWYGLAVSLLVIFGVWVRKELKPR